MDMNKGDAYLNNDNDKLKKLWEVQLAFNDKFFLKKLGKPTSELTMDEKVFWTKNQLLSIVKETMEVLDEVPAWKEHRNTTQNFVPSNLYEEIIDVNKFTVGLAQIWGMTLEQYYDEYLRKSYVVEQRWQQEQELKLIDKNSKIVGIDIDGILGQYPYWFVKYASEQLGKPFETLEQIKMFLGTSRYEALKHNYRQSGAKATMPADPYAATLTSFLKYRGYTIIVLTARPYRAYSRIYPDTLQFLKSNNIEFDAIIWDENKHLKIIEEFPNMEFMIEDNPTIAKQIAEEGYKVYYKPCSEIKLHPSHDNIKHIDKLWDIILDLGGGPSKRDGS